MNQKVADEMRLYFKNLEVCLIETGGSHAVFLKNPEEFMKKVVGFTRRVKAEVSGLFSLLCAVADTYLYNCSNLR